MPAYTIYSIPYTVYHTMALFGRKREGKRKRKRKGRGKGKERRKGMEGKGREEGKGKEMEEKGKGDGRTSAVSTLASWLVAVNRILRGERMKGMEWTGSLPVSAGGHQSSLEGGKTKPGGRGWKKFELNST